MIAILDDNSDALDGTVQSVMALGYDPAGFSNPKDLLRYLARTPTQLLILGESAARDRSIMRTLKRDHTALPVIVLASGDCSSAHGFQALAKPFTQSTLDSSITHALQPETLPH